MSEFRMPSLGSDMEAGTLVEWLKAPGDTVHRGDIVAVVETQKGAIEVEIFEDGVIEELLVDVGQTVPVGTPLARVRSAGEAARPVAAEPTAAAAAAPAAPVGSPRTAVEAATPSTAPPPGAPPMPAPPPAGAAPRASPAARQRAAERGIDLAKIRGSGPDGAVVLADVEAASAPPAAAAPSAPKARGLDLAEMRKAIAAALSRSKREIPHYYLAHDVDLTAAGAWLERRNATRPPTERVLMGALLLKAVALALTRHKDFNGFYGPGGFSPSEAVHVGTAVSIRGGGLVAPAIHNTDKLALDAIMAKMRDLVARVRAGSLRSSELSDPTVTVSSLGERGVERMFSIIYPPQVAILGIGKVAMRPWPCDDGGIALRPVVTVTLAGDHRVSDGHRGALFLNEIDRRLQEPEAL